MTIELKLLGGFDALVDGQPIEQLRAPAPTRLLAYLALHRAKRPRRVYLAAMFWPDGTDARARRRLSHTLWVLQSALAPVSATLVQADRDTIGLDPGADVWIDVEAFEGAISAFGHRRRDGTGHLHTDIMSGAVDLYRGDLLRDHYDEWIVPIREGLREKYLLGLGQLAQLQKSRGDYGAALVTGRLLVSETPLAEQAHAELMRLYWLVGRPDEATAQYDACQAILAEELGVQPGLELTVLRDRIAAKRRPALSPGAAAPVHAGTPTTNPTSLVGRAESRSQVLDVVDSALGGVGGFALIEGHAGMGKTRLLSSVAEAARWRSATVSWAHYNDQLLHEPYAGLSVALSTILTGLRLEQVLARLDPDHARLASRVLPVLGTSPASETSVPDPATGASGWMSPDERWKLQEALTKVVMTLGAVAPTVLILDDLQWCDLETLEFLRLLAPQLANSQVAVLLSYRTQDARNRTEVWNLLKDIEMRQAVERVLLSGLATHEVAALAASRFSAPMPADTFDRLERATGGNPLFIIETIRAIERTASVEERDAVIDEQLGGRATVERVMQVLLRQIDSAPSAVQSLVGALAIWGQPATSATLSRLTELTMSTTLDAIREGMAAEFIAEDSGRYGLQFDQLAGAARARIASPERRSVHLRAAQLLAEDPLAPAAALAAHYREAGAWADSARHETAAATRAARIHSYGTAVRFYELALDSLQQAGREPSVGLLFGHETVLDILGRRDDQARLLEQLQASEGMSVLNSIRAQQRQAIFLANTEALDDAIRVGCSAVGFAVASGIDPAPYVVTLAQVLGMAGHPDLARKHLEGLADTGDGSTGLAHAHLGLGQALIELQDRSEAESQLTVALELFGEQQDARGQVEALTALAVLRSQIGTATTAFRLYHEAIALARQHGIRPGEAMALVNLGLLNYMTGNASAALGCMGEAIDVFVSIGHGRGEARVRANRAAIWHTVLGDDVAAEREVTLARRYFVGVGDRRHEAQCLDILAGIRRRKGSHGQSRRLLRAALDIVQANSDPWAEAQMLRSLAWTESEAGRPDDALEALGKAIGMAEGCALELEYAALLALEARSLQACNKPEQALAAANRSLQETQQGSEMTHITAWWRYTVFSELGHDETAQTDLEVAHRALVKLLEPFDEQARERSLARVAEHAAITNAYASQFARTKHVVLAAAVNPNIEHTTELEWTVHHPEDLYVAGKKERRRRRVLRLLSQAREAGAHARVEDLAAALDASVSTLKRDLAALRAEGLLE